MLFSNKTFAIFQRQGLWDLIDIVGGSMSWRIHRNCQNPACGEATKVPVLIMEKYRTDQVSKIVPALQFS
jgi:hypothetical protein